MIDIDYLKQLLDIFDESTVNDLRIDKEGTSIRLTKNPKKEGAESTAYHYVAAPQAPATPPPSAPSPVDSGTSAAPAETKQEAASKGTAASDKGLHTIQSPIVGTFYTAPNPDSPSFVVIGSQIKPGEVLCIVEAMKLMNEIESDVAGEVVEILVENAQPVEYGQPLFQIRVH